MNPTSYTVQCAEPIGDALHLSHAVMGNLAYNLLRTGVKLQQTLEGICGTPLLRRTMSMLNSGIGIDKSTGVYREDAKGNPVYDFTLMDQIMDVLVSPEKIQFLFFTKTRTVSYARLKNGGLPAGLQRCS